MISAVPADALAPAEATESVVMKIYIYLDFS